MNGTRYVTSIFADDMTWEITGRSVVSRKYASTRDFLAFNELWQVDAVTGGSAASAVAFA
jgi:hypothetical protein